MQQAARWEAFHNACVTGPAAVLERPVTNGSFQPKEALRPAVEVQMVYCAGEREEVIVLDRGWAGRR